MRKPDYIIGEEKKQMLLERLTPITDWNSVRRGTEIFNKASTTIYNYDIFIKKEGHIVKYTSKYNEDHEWGDNGWYFYDQYDVNLVEEYFTPKLYMYKKELYVAFNKEHLEEILGKPLNEKDIEHISIIGDYSVQLV